MFSRQSLKLHLLSLLALSTTPILAQNLLAGAPPCASACAALTGTSTSCTPELTDDPIGCFCGLNAALPDQSTTYCADGCPDPTSQQQLVSWFERKCSSGAPTTTTSTTPATSSTSLAPGPTAPKSPTGNNGYSGNGGGGGGGSHHSGPPKSWWDKHARWIAMVIVLIIGFSVITVLGVFFKRRYDRKHNNAANTPATAAWGPNTSQFRTSTISEEGGYGEAQSGNPPMQERTSYEKGKGKRLFGR